MTGCSCSEHTHWWSVRVCSYSYTLHTHDTAYIEPDCRCSWSSGLCSSHSHFSTNRDLTLPTSFNGVLQLPENQEMIHWTRVWKDPGHKVTGNTSRAERRQKNLELWRRNRKGESYFTFTHGHPINIKVYVWREICQIRLQKHQKIKHVNTDSDSWDCYLCTTV